MTAESGMSVLEIKDSITQDYQWDFKIPPKSRIVQNIRNLRKLGFNFTDMKFKNGILAGVDHSWGFALYSNQINIYLCLPKVNVHRKIGIKSTRLDLMSKSQVKASHDLVLKNDENSEKADELWSIGWVNRDGSWDDTVDAMRINLNIECEYSGRSIKYGSLESEYQHKLFNTSSTPLILDASEFFLSTNLSDITFHCKGSTFPAHRFLLSCKSQVFNRMLQNDMRESKEGLIVIEDMEPHVLRELLRFMYSGRVEGLEELSLDLFVAADKYDLEDLQVQCQRLLLRTVKPENALELYALAESHGGKALMEKTVEVLKLYRQKISENKTGIVQTAEAFRDFSVRYPELMFELYKI